MTPNPSTNSANFPTELMFTKRIRSIFDKLLPEKTRHKYERANKIRQDKVHFKTNRNGKEGWEDGLVTRKKLEVSPI